MTPSLTALTLIINSKLSLTETFLGARFTPEGVEVPEALGLFAQSIGVRNAEHLLTALQEFPNGFEAVLNLPKTQFLKARAELMEKLDELITQRRKLYTLSLPKKTRQA